MPFVKPEKKTATPVGVLILLSFIFPGAAQFANNEKWKGAIFIAVYSLVFIAFLFQFVNMLDPIKTALIMGKPPEIDEKFIDNIKTMVWIMVAGFVVMSAAIIDAVVVAKRADANQK